MIRIVIDPAAVERFNALVQAKVRQMEYVASPNVMTEVAKAAFTVTSRRFLEALSEAAHIEPQKYHHVYEWNNVGRTTRKLFILKRVKYRYGDLMIEAMPLQSRVPVPIDPRLIAAGDNNKIVKSKHIFRNKMQVMEEGKPVEIVSVSAKKLAFPGENGIIFRNSVRVEHPGGIATKGSFEKFMLEWYETRAEIVIEQSRLIRQLANSTALVLNSNNTSIAAIQDAARAAMAAYSKDLDMI